MSAPSTDVPDLSLFARAIGVITSPGSTFQTVARFPRPASILLLVCLVIGLATGLPQFTARGQQMALDAQVQQIEGLTGQPVTPEMYTAMEGRARYGGYTAILGVLIVLPIVCLLITAVLWVIFNTIMGGTATFKHVLAVVTHSQVIGALGAAIGAPIQYMQGMQTMAGPFNLGAVAPMLEPGSFPANLLGALSIFGVWQTVVAAIGLAVLYRRKTTPIAIGLLVVYVGLMGLVTLVFSSFGGR